MLLTVLDITWSNVITYFLFWIYKYLLHCLYHLQERITLLNTVNTVNTILFPIIYLIYTKRFDAQHFLCSPDAMALTLILILKSILLFLLLSYIFFNFMVFFASRYIATFICIPGDCRFFRLMCKDKKYLWKIIYDDLVV